MKTPMQELIDEMTYMLTEGERSIYALREKARKLLEKETDMFEEIIDIIDSENSGLSAEQRLDEINRLIRTFNAKER
jgi:uncharacterized coiled-coil protein SlyX